eukprot:scaffold102338_cov68-Phaeocystis_antarctica.AAC.1
MSSSTESRSLQSTSSARRLAPLTIPSRQLPRHVGQAVHHVHVVVVQPRQQQPYLARAALQRRRAPLALLPDVATLIQVASDHVVPPPPLAGGASPRTAPVRNCPLANISAGSCSPAFRSSTMGCSLEGVSAALSGTAGRSRSWSAPGQGLAHSYEVDPDRQAAPRWPACCPRPTNSSLRSPRCRPRAAQKRSAEGSRKAVTAVLTTSEPASLSPLPLRRMKGSMYLRRR